MTISACTCSLCLEHGRRLFRKGDVSHIHQQSILSSSMPLSMTPPYNADELYDSGDPTISIPVGIIVGLLASFVQSLGLTIQRKSHVQNQSLPESEQKTEARRP